jgi:hypothetical protein
MSDPLTGLRLDIYRGPYGDASNGGISGRTDHVTLIGTLDVDGMSSLRDRRRVKLLEGDSRGPFAVSDDAPAVILVWRKTGSQLLSHVEPLEPAPRGGYMAGGTYLHGDSRFSDLAGFYGAVSFHDRSE